MSGGKKRQIKAEESFQTGQLNAMCDCELDHGHGGKKLYKKSYYLHN